MIELAKHLQSLRKKANMSQEDLAEQLHISRQAVSKWEQGQSTPDVETCLKLCELLNIDEKDAIAIGDDYNDISMFKIVGYSVAMENSSDEVKSYADHVTKSNEEDGVAIFLEKLINNENEVL